jgi:hypothetical protein
VVSIEARGAVARCLTRVACGDDAVLEDRRALCSSCLRAVLCGRVLCRRRTDRAFFVSARSDADDLVLEEALPFAAAPALLAEERVRIAIPARRPVIFTARFSAVTAIGVVRHVVGEGAPE